MPLPAVLGSIILALMMALHLLMARRMRRLREELDRQQRQIEALEARLRPPPPVVPRPITARFTPRGTSRLPDPSPQANLRVPEPSPHGVPRLSEPAPRSSTRTSEPSPRSSTRLPDPSPRSSTGLGEPSPGSSPALAGGGWAPTHRITFTPDRGRPETWMVMITAAPGSGRAGATKAEWSAGVDPAWRCDPAGAWSYRGQSTPQGVRGTVRVEEIR